MLKPTAFRLEPGWERQSLRAPQAPKLSVRLKSSFAIFMEDAKKQQFFVFISPFSSVKLVNEVCIYIFSRNFRNNNNFFAILNIADRILRFVNNNESEYLSLVTKMRATAVARPDVYTFSL